MHPDCETQILAATRRLGCACLLGLALLAQAAPAVAAGGRFDVRSAGSRLVGGVYYVDARLDLRLSDKALEALQSGLELTIQLELEVLRRRAFLPDARVAELKQASLLSYQPLSQRYVVKNLNSGEQTSYATLFSALNGIGRITDLPVIDAALLNPDATHRMRLRAVLDQNTLPGPLRLIAFWSDGFRLVSDWYGWTLKD